MVDAASNPSLLAALLGIVALALAPVAFFLWFFYTRDKLNPEPRGLILTLFILGLVASVPVLLLQQIPLLPWLMAVIVVPIVSELAKFAVVYTKVYHHPEFDEPVDGIIFAAVTGLGFATLAVVGSMVLAYLNLLPLAVPNGDQLPAWTAVLQMFALQGLLVAPGHALWSALWGYGLGRAKFSPAPQSKALVIRGLGAAMLCHAAFNSLLLESHWWLNRLGLVALIALLWFVVLRSIRYALALAPSLDGGY